MLLPIVRLFVRDEIETFFYYYWVKRKREKRERVLSFYNIDIGVMTELIDKDYLKRKGMNTVRYKLRCKIIPLEIKCERYLPVWARKNRVQCHVEHQVRS